MKRARRTGMTSRQIGAATASAARCIWPSRFRRSKRRLRSGFVMVLEDTSELLRAQKAAAWHEVARRIAHEIKNPLTPIALSAERIARQLERAAPAAGVARIVRECADTIVARSGIGEEPGGRVLAIRALPGGAAGAHAT